MNQQAVLRGEKLERWQGPPHTNTTKHYKTSLFVYSVMRIRRVWLFSLSIKNQLMKIHSHKLQTAPLTSSDSSSVFVCLFVCSFVCFTADGSFIHSVAEWPHDFLLSLWRPLIGQNVWTQNFNLKQTFCWVAKTCKPVTENSSWWWFMSLILFLTLSPAAILSRHPVVWWFKVFLVE